MSRLLAERRALRGVSKSSDNHQPDTSTDTFSRILQLDLSLAPRERLWLDFIDHHPRGRRGINPAG